MQAKLLAKVEELTLHMIQAEKHNDRLETQNRQPQERIARLEANMVLAESAKGPKVLATHAAQNRSEATRPR